jgi:pentose-5-phosphate-3-epimerase
MKDRIVGAILEKTWTKVEERSNYLKKNLSKIQIDMCDGLYVPATTWPFTESINLKNDLYLPNWETVTYSADIMSSNPLNVLDIVVAYGFEEIIIHYRSVKSSEEWQNIFDKSQKFELKLSVAIDVNTNLDEFIDFAKENIANINAFQVMGIQNIGRQGEKFDEKSLEIIKILFDNFDRNIFVDGGVNSESIEKLVESGAYGIVVGSYLDQNIQENLGILKSEMHIE